MRFPFGIDIELLYGATPEAFTCQYPAMTGGDMQENTRGLSVIKNNYPAGFV